MHHRGLSHDLFALVILRAANASVTLFAFYCSDSERISQARWLCEAEKRMKVTSTPTLLEKGTEAKPHQDRFRAKQQAEVIRHEPTKTSCGAGEPRGVEYHSGREAETELLWCVKPVSQAGRGGAGRREECRHFGGSEQGARKLMCLCIPLLRRPC